MDNQIEDDCRVQLLEHVPYMAFVSERIMHACGQLKTIINRSWNFALDAENEKTVTHPRFSWRLTALNNTVGPYQFYWILTSKLTLIVLFYYFQVIPFWYFYLSRLPDHVITVTNENHFKKDGDKQSANVFPIPSKYRRRASIMARANCVISW